MAKLRARFGDLQDKIFAALGVTYKPNVDDMRESPAVEVIHLLREAGANVQVFDPYIADAPDLGGPLTESVTAAAAQADGIVLLVHHREFLDLDPADLADVVKQRVVLDTRNVLARSK